METGINSENIMGMNGTNQTQLDGGESSPNSKSFGGLNTIISKLINQKSPNEQNDKENIVNNSPGPESLGTSSVNSPSKLSEPLYLVSTISPINIRLL
jgi:hypothetical protein